MSRAGARASRSAHDFYETPAWAARAMVGVVLAELRPHPAAVFLDPAAGRGVFFDAVRQVRPSAEVVNVDLVARREYTESGAFSFTGDWLQIAPDFTDAVDVVIGNPPYSLAEEFVRASLEIADNVAFLLRLGFLAGRKRRQWLKTTPLSDVWPFARRPSFTGDGKTDGADYGVFLWRRGYTGTIITHLDMPEGEPSGKEEG